MDFSVVLELRTKTHLAFTCSKLIIETLEQGEKYIQDNNKDTRMTPMASFWCLYY